jgi:hypothetical protein
VLLEDVLQARSLNEGKEKKAKGKEREKIL